MPKLVPATLLITTLLSAAILTGQEPPVQPARFAGTWVGTQAWALKNPPPGASRDQAVTLSLEVVDGKVVGTIVPFLGGEDGATIVDSVIVGDELRATAVVGRPRPSQAAGRRGGGPPNWKDPIKVSFVLRNEGVTMTGTADVQMDDVPWLKFNYQLGLKRNRY